MSAQQVEVFPWIIWYIWKARNDKVFNNKDTSPMDTIQLAIKEAESLRLAQMATEILDIGGDDLPVGGDQSRQEIEAGRWKCQVDASWIEEQGATGLGFVLIDDGRSIMFGSRGNISSASPLHAKAEGIIWAMQEILKSGRREI